MLRAISNRIHGRRKTADTAISLSEVRDLLLQLNGTSKVNLSYRCNGDIARMDKTSSETSEFISQRFGASLCQYCEATHEVYTDGRREEHYIDVREGLLEKDGKKERPYREATLEYRTVK